MGKCSWSFCPQQPEDSHTFSCPDSRKVQLLKCMELLLYKRGWNCYVVHEALTTRVRQFIMASTAEVYPYTKEKVYWRESDNLSVNAASSPYAASKRGAEEVVKEAGERGLNYTILRCTNTYGRSNPAL